MSLGMSCGLSRITYEFAFLCLVTAIMCGCGGSEGLIQETDEYSFDDVASQVAAEEAASQKEREK